MFFGWGGGTLDALSWWAHSLSLSPCPEKTLTPSSCWVHTRETQGLQTPFWGKTGDLGVKSGEELGIPWNYSSSLENRIHFLWRQWLFWRVGSVKLYPTEVAVLRRLHLQIFKSFPNWGCQPTPSAPTGGLEGPSNSTGRLAVILGDPQPSSGGYQS